ncbi:AraC family transcriptional regulator [Acinetobacter sp. WU_MDCI_Axc73]|nr:AraC family transcriptional regulator [Acinetobacter sp. WU_MDCI_Axc73]
MTAYNLKLKRVCDYIQQHLDDSLNLQGLSEVAGLSRFHFHRIFYAHMGMNVMKYTQMLRLRRASFQLVFKQEYKIIDIALDAGFDSPEAFARAFKRSFDQTPRAFRAEPNWQNWHKKFVYFTPESELEMNVNIIERPVEKIAYISHLGSPEKVFESAAKFISWRKKTGLSPVATSATYGIPFSDPEQTPEQAFRFDIAGSITKPIEKNEDGVEMGEIPAGRFAVIRHLGSHDRIRDSVYFLFRNWLPEHQEEAGDFPVFFQYHNFVHEVNEADLVTDIYLLLK